MIKVCEWCSREYIAQKHNQRFCSKSCKMLHDMDEREQRIKEKAEKPKRKTKMSELSRIQMLAEAAGMSYGQYVAKMESKDVKRNRTNK